MSKYPSSSVFPTWKDSKSVLLHFIQWHPHSIFKFSLRTYLYLVYLYNSLEKKREIPIEIDDHFRLFGKEPWEVDYGEKCPVCDVRIDEYGFCSCGSSGDWIFSQMVG